jgi:hypothetical protein
VGPRSGFCFGRNLEGSVLLCSSRPRCHGVTVVKPRPGYPDDIASWYLPNTLALERYLFVEILRKSVQPVKCRASTRS